MKILYVEDNDDNVYMLKNRLSRAGFIVIIFTFQALREVANQSLGLTAIFVHKLCSKVEPSVRFRTLQQSAKRKVCAQHEGSQLGTLRWC
jgi:CheY-like chemotaxis protein